MVTMGMAWRILEFNNRLSIHFGDAGDAMDTFPCWTLGR